MIKFGMFILLSFASASLLAYDYSESGIGVRSVWVKNSVGYYRFYRTTGTFEGCDSVVMYTDSTTVDAARNHYLSLLTTAKVTGSKVRAYWSIGGTGKCILEILNLE